MKIRKLKYYGIGSIMMGLSLTMVAGPKETCKTGSEVCSYCSQKYGIPKNILDHVNELRTVDDETIIEITEVLCEAIYTYDIVKKSKESNEEKFDRIDQLLQKINRAQQNLHYFLNYGDLELDSEYKQILDGFKSRLQGMKSRIVTYRKELLREIKEEKEEAIRNEAIMKNFYKNPKLYKKNKF